MQHHLALIALVVRDYDEAIEYYSRVLNFQLVEDTIMSTTKRWVVMQPAGGSEGCKLLLAKAANETQATRIGNQTGGRVFLFLHTDNFNRDFQHLKQQNVPIVRGPVQEPYGTVAVFSDLYGNLWDLIEPAK